MSRSVNVSKEAYKWLLEKSSQDTIKQNKNISIADVIDEIIKLKN